jgi:hypothetical protein
VAAFSEENWLPPDEQVRQELAAYRGGWLAQAMPIRVRAAPSGI